MGRNIKDVSIEDLTLYYDCGQKMKNILDLMKWRDTGWKMRK